VVLGEHARGDAAERELAAGDSGRAGKEVQHVASINPRGAGGAYL